jgi:sulfur-carrier protein
MLTLRFFARLREQLDTAQLQWPVAADIETLIDALAAARGAAWSEALRAPNIIVAVNQVVAAPGQVLSDGDEVAFFPPVTGG